MTHPPEITAKSWLIVTILGFTWGGTFIAIEIALFGLTPFWVAAGRIVFGALFMTSVWAARGFPLFKEKPNGSTLGATVLVGAFSSAIPFMLVPWGQQYVTSGFAGVSMAAVSLFVLPLAHFLVPGERLSTRKALGFLTGFAGVCVLIGAQAFTSSGAAMETAGRVACLGAALCYAISSILMRRLPEVDNIGLVSCALIIGSIVVVPVALIVEGIPPSVNAATLAVVIGMGVIPTAAASLLRVLVIRSAGPVFMSLTGYQVPVWSVVLGAAVLGEPLPPSLLVAMALILTGMGLSQYGALSRLFRKS